ncbi:AAA family ATPase [Pontibacter populi]|uniref:AAA family ATPase n=1 Tax=Pontibacter populi TaxID=890055 RepID=A0ABV1RSM7_9BACT
MPLRSLNELANEAKAKFEHNDYSNELELSDDFKHIFEQTLEDSQVTFYKHTFIITKSDGLRIYGPNQWFVLGIHLVDFLQELKEYKRHTARIFSSQAPRGTAKELQPIYVRLKNAGSPERISADDASAIDSYFSLESDRMYYKQFVTNYNWWVGSKGLDRGDYAYTPLLTIPKLVHDTHSLVAGIALMYASNPALLEAIIPIADRAVSQSTQQIVVNTQLNLPHNWIVYGAPGTGKSNYLDAKANALFAEDNRLRVTFYPDYSYSKFVGTYKPVPVYKTVPSADNSVYYDYERREHTGETRREPIIDYKFVPGPFLTQLVKALKSPSEPVLLQIEEVNRANAAAVFGEVFQLLDRDNGRSCYSVGLSKEAMKYIQDEVEGFCSETVSLPSNLYLWATMNSADQGVLPLDSAFKRRWVFKYLPLNRNAGVISDWSFNISGVEFSWALLREIINTKLASEKVSEDKLLGPFFISRSVLSDTDAVISNLLLYLREDVVRHKPSVLFNDIDGSYNLSKLIQRFKSFPLDTFTFSIHDAVINDTGTDTEAQAILNEDQQI